MTVPPNAVVFGEKLLAVLMLATKDKQTSIEIKAGYLHRLAGGYPGPNHRMPVCCDVMRAEMRDGDTVVEEPPSGYGATFTVKYLLPRHDSNSEIINESFARAREDALRVLSQRKR